ncbi:MAG: lactate utilization protein [Ruminococcus bromii]|nr:lactate utilization protein [Ruminococcus bromii]
MEQKDMVRRTQAMELRIRRTMEALEKNNMRAYYAETSADAVRVVESLLQEGDTITCGGSVTLDATGVKALMRSGRYNFLDREAVETEEERQKIYHAAFSADAYLTSANAITERGELYNVDGTGNRVAAMLFGPSKVIVVAGYNKIVRDLGAAAAYVKGITAPANALRLHIDTPCTHAACPGTDGGLCDGCRAESRICGQYTVIARQRVQNRIHVVLVGEEVGY